MPELPEVETVARELRSLIIGKEIKGIKAIWQKTFTDQCGIPLSGQIIREINRRGKYLTIILSKSVLIIHLRMTGQLLFKPALPENSDTHIRAKIFFSDQSALYFKDTRKFGRIYHLDNAENLLHKIGIDAIDPRLSSTVFRNMLIESKTSVKAFLLGQDKIAGIGNIYADESLFKAGIHPGSIANKIPYHRMKLLHSKIIDTLNDAIVNMGSTISDYRNTYGNPGNNQKFFGVYQREDLPCVKCGSLIMKSKIAGRGTHFCPKCQKKYI